MPGTKTLYLPNSARTGGFALPRGVESEVEAEHAQMREELHKLSERLNHFNRELRQIDPDLSVMLAQPRTTVQGLKPNYYHLVRMRPGHAAFIKPIEWPNGEWRDLGEHVYQLAAEADMWNDRTQREWKERSRRAEEARKRQAARESQDRAGEFDARWKSATNVSISVPRSV